MRQITTTKPLFLFLLPVFFVLHGYLVNYGVVSLKDALLLALFYIGIAVLIAGLSWLIYRNLVKASLFALLLLAFQFFFGSVLDILKEQIPQAFFLRYRILLPFCLLFFFIAFIWLKRRKKSLAGLLAYFNVLLLVVTMVDAGWLIIKKISLSQTKTINLAADGLSVCDTCSKPDIFFIVPDQYTGSTALKDVFGMDNSDFENALESRGFHLIKHGSSNYNLTPFSMASTLNMDFPALKKGKQNYRSVSYSYRVIRNSRVIKYLAASGYRFYNCSIFDFPGQPANRYGAFLPYGTELITALTFTARIASDFRADVLSGKFGLRKMQKEIAYEHLHYNDAMIERTQSIAAQKNNAPKFVYTHLMMPHYPYYFDSKGKQMSLEKLSGFRNTDSKDYLEYLLYTNKRLLQLVDTIISSSPDPPIIILLSDHGFRHPQKDADRKYDFINLNAVYLPDKKYNLFYDSITNVNQFRVLFNTYFNQHLPLLKDSTTNVWD